MWFWQNNPYDVIIMTPKITEIQNFQKHFRIFVSYQLDKSWNFAEMLYGVFWTIKKAPHESLLSNST